MLTTPDELASLIKKMACVEEKKEEISSLSKKLERLLNGYLDQIVDEQDYRNQKVKLLSIAEILFDKNPTVITGVKVAEVGKDYAVITWETNHYTKNNKVNYGESLSYGQDVLSQERARHHELRISDLKPNTEYFFEVMSQNKNYVYDAFHAFTTLEE